jgi:hypothetical protein
MGMRTKPSNPGNPVRSQINPATDKGSKKGSAAAIAQKRKQIPSPVFVCPAFEQVMAPHPVEPPGEGS